MQTLRENQLYDKYNKCDFFKDQIQHLGHVRSADDVAVDPKNMKTILEWTTPKNVVDIRSFLGLPNTIVDSLRDFQKSSFQ